jgi:DNA/RNA-binding domain of Phe-tRNA-synthetase-like protein
VRAGSITFDIEEAVLAAGLSGAYFTLAGIHNRESDPGFDEIGDATLREIARGLSPETVKDDPILRGFRSLHEKVGVSNRKNVASPENLLNTLLHSGRLPRINVLVDIYNLVSAKSRLALGAHDLAHICGNIHLRMTTGAESFWPLGSAKPKAVGPGEYAYVDDKNDIICRLETRQVEKTKVTAETTECFYIVQGNNATDGAYIKSVTEELIALTKRFCGGQERMLYAPWLAD